MLSRDNQNKIKMSKLKESLKAIYLALKLYKSDKGIQNLYIENYKRLLRDAKHLSDGELCHIHVR